MKMNNLLKIALLVSPLLFSCNNKTATEISSSSNNDSSESSSSEPEPEEISVIVLAGQSNMEGNTWSQYISTSYGFSEEEVARIKAGYQDITMSYRCFYNGNPSGGTDSYGLFMPVKLGQANTTSKFGPEIGIAETLSEQSDTSYIIKATYSGSCLQTQYVTNGGRKLKLYTHFVKFIKRQLKVLESENKTPRVRGVFWMQGESDTFLSYSNKYGKAEKYFLDYLRIDLNNWIYDHFNFVDAYIYTGGICWVNPEIVNECKQQIADSNEHCYCIKTNGEDETAIKLYLKSETNEGDDLAHYCSSSMLLLGKTAGEYLIK